MLFHEWDGTLVEGQRVNSMDQWRQVGKDGAMDRQIIFVSRMKPQIHASEKWADAAKEVKCLLSQNA